MSADYSILDDVFEVTQKDPDGKKFDRGELKWGGSNSVYRAGVVSNSAVMGEGMFVCLAGQRGRP